MEMNIKTHWRIFIHFRFTALIIPCLLTGDLHHVQFIGDLITADHLTCDFHEVFIKGSVIRIIQIRYFYQSLIHSPDRFHIGIGGILHHQRQSADVDRPGTVMVISHLDKDIRTIHLIGVGSTGNRRKVSCKGNITCTVDIVLQRQQIQKFRNAHARLSCVAFPDFRDIELLIPQDIFQPIFITADSISLLNNGHFPVIINCIFSNRPNNRF